MDDNEAFALGVMRMSRETYDSLTPSEFAKCAEMFINHERRKSFKVDFNFARITCMFANAYRDAKEHPTPFTISEFMPDEHKKDPDPESVRTGLSNWSKGVAICKKHNDGIK